MWSRTFDSSAAIRSTSSSVSSQARQARDVEDLLAVDHVRPILGGWTRRHRGAAARAARTRSRPRRCARRRSTTRRPPGSSAAKQEPAMPRRPAVEQSPRTRTRDEQHERRRARPTGAVTDAGGHRLGDPAPSRSSGPARARPARASTSRTTMSHPRADQPLRPADQSRKSAREEADRAQPRPAARPPRSGLHGCSPRAPARRPACSSRRAAACCAAGTRSSSARRRRAPA